MVSKGSSSALAKQMEPYKEIVCEVCGALVRYSDLPKIEKGNIRYVAVDHKDHFLVIKYDRFGVIRAADVYFRPPEIGKVVIEVECPKCHVKERIPVKTFPSEFAVKHDDHILVVFAVDKELTLLSTYDLIVMEESYLANELSRIVKMIGIYRFTSLLAEMILFERKVVYVPQSLIPNFRRLLNYLGFKDTTIRPGFISLLDEKYLVFLKSVLKSPDSFYNLESLKRIIHMIKSLENRLLEDIDRPNEIMGLIEQMKERGLYDLIVDAIRNNYGIDVEDKIRMMMRK